jgi:hypothetical protein
MNSISWKMGMEKGKDNKNYNVIYGYEIKAGSKADMKCDIAFEQTSAVPYVFPSAIHTRPRLVSLEQANREKYNVQDSGIGEDWEYFSRRLDKPPTPKNVVVHIGTILRDI